MEGISVSFHHIQFYVDALQPLSEYKEHEKLFSGFVNEHEKQGRADLEAGRALFTRMIERTKLQAAPAEYSSLNQDLVKQLIGVLGFRVTGYNSNSGTTSMLLTTNDAGGTKIR